MGVGVESTVEWTALEGFVRGKVQELIQESAGGGGNRAPPPRAKAVAARKAFAKRFGPWYPKAVDVLEDDWDRMVTFYDFQEAHWQPHARRT